ncbi:thiamine phosphate synthase [Tenacibaculum sp. 190524A02b]|uniref:thiamine phosphate synthase n=1 Tax=Tenacibaculum vairaonense TaxID=3137860 RepID=UPI0031FAF753
MLIVLTSEQEIKNEAILLNQLFKNGLEILHLRKPTFDIEGYRNLLKKINPKYYQNIMIHEHHELCLEFGLKGIHLQEQPRINLGSKLQEYVNSFQNKSQELKAKSHTVSSSFHDPEVLNNCTTDFDYHILSPVFSSISKKGYEGKGFDVNTINKKIIGMGGVNTTSIPKVFALGYSGIGVLGGIWNAENPIESFKEIKKQFEKYIN